MVHILKATLAHTDMKAQDTQRLKQATPLQKKAMTDNVIARWVKTTSQTKTVTTSTLKNNTSWTETATTSSPTAKHTTLQPVKSALVQSAQHLTSH